MALVQRADAGFRNLKRMFRALGMRKRGARDGDARADILRLDRFTVLNARGPEGPAASRLTTVLGGTEQGVMIGQIQTS